MSVTSLTGTTWVLNTSLTYSPFTFDGTNGKETYIYADVTSNGYQYTRIQVLDWTQVNTFYVRYRNDTSTTVYQNGWVSEDYRTITFLGEPYRNPSVFYCATLEEAISWLEANAVQILPDVSVSLGTSSIASLNDTGSVTLATQNTYLTDDITVEYTKPSAPTPTLQSKSVSYTPTTSQQTASVTADAGYDGLSAVNVTVNAMPSGSATTPATTITANPTISVSASGLITASVSKTQGVTPTVSAGYVESGTSGTINVNGSNTNQLTVYNGAHHSNIISFTIASTTYQAVNGDTWSEWVSSDYNTDGFYVANGKVWRALRYYVSNGSTSPSDVIVSGHSYTIVMVGSGN